MSAADVLSGAADVRQFEDKLVLVGVTALAIGDYQATPVADRMPGVEIHAQLIEGIFDGDLLSRPWWTVWLEAAVLAAAGGILILAVPALPAAASTAIAAALAAATMALALGFYFGGRILFDATVPIIGMGALFTAMLGTTLAEAQGQRRALRRQVARQREIAARLAGELEAARRIQMGSLPTPAAAFPGETRFDLYAFLAPAREVGGDLYDFFRLDADRIFLLVGDVSGKGLPGSLFMAMSKSLCKSIALRDPGDVGSVMRQADREISRDNAESLFVTVWAGIVDAATGEIQYGNAGHDAPYLLFPGRPPGRLSASGGPPLCVVDEFPYEASRYRMRRGEILCLVTDGVTDATSAAGELLRARAARGAARGHAARGRPGGGGRGGSPRRRALCGGGRGRGRPRPAHPPVEWPVSRALAARRPRPRWPRAARAPPARHLDLVGGRSTMSSRIFWARRRDSASLDGTLPTRSVWPATRALIGGPGRTGCDRGRRGRSAGPRASGLAAERARAGREREQDGRPNAAAGGG